MFHQANQGPLCVSFRTRNGSAHKAGEVVLILLRGGILTVFSSSTGTWDTFSSYGGDAHSKLVCSDTSGRLSSYDRHLRNLHEAWQGNTDTSRSEAGD